MQHKLPVSIRVTGAGYDDSLSSYKIQIGDQHRTVAYAWAPFGGRPDDAVIKEAKEIAARIIAGWNVATDEEAQQRIVLDVWGGEGHMEHVARFIPRIVDALPMAARELAAGFLVNMRQDHAWGTMTPFDERVGVEALEGTVQ